ncbi:hypothetical protein N7462_003903 [Penicillium macrosclerotiorum]|uniref:uncharacterized protein n=1 Tax=Penicillium macrosclerotiorum TaxID=303699 RepID=UPI002547E6F7|nr:uncharacterized protein N7462_003903 [Penicillium macrosclerotiorum]KAJ5689511.1 hypothetical protein N7462_003903 [Penicillium macrosclerotiorum]
MPPVTPAKNFARHLLNVLAALGAEPGAGWNLAIQVAVFFFFLEGVWLVPTGWMDVRAAASVVRKADYEEGVIVPG